MSFNPSNELDSVVGSPDSHASDDPNYNLEFADDVLSSPDDHLETRNTYSDYEQDLEDVMRLGVPTSVLEGGDEEHTGAPLQNEDDHPTNDVEASVAEKDAEAMRATTPNPYGAPANPVGGLTVTDNFGPTICTPMPPSTPLPGSEVAVLARADARVPRTSILNYFVAGTTPHGPGRRDGAPPTGAAVSVRHASARSPDDATPMDTSQVEPSATYGFADASLREPAMYDESEIACQGSIRIERAVRRAQELPDLHSQPDSTRGHPESALADARNGAVRNSIAARARSPDTAPSIDASCAINSGQVTMSTIDELMSSSWPVKPKLARRPSQGVELARAREARVMPHGARDRRPHRSESLKTRTRAGGTSARSLSMPRTPVPATPTLPTIQYDAPTPLRVPRG